MTIDTKFRNPGKVKARYVRKSAHAPGRYAWCEQRADKSHLDLAQGLCDADDLPEDIRTKCDNYTGAFYACEWPMENTND